MKNYKLKIFNFVIFVVLFFFVHTASAQVVINEIQISPTGERFIELYNSGGADVDLTGWYIQRKTSTGTSFGSMVSKPNFDNKKVVAGGYFLISRNQLEKTNIIVDSLTLTESNVIQIKNSAGEVADLISWESIESGKSYQRTSSGGWIISTPTPGSGNSASTTTSSPVGSQDTVASAVTQAPQTGSTSSFAPQITVDVGPQTRTAFVGALIAFEGRVLVSKKETTEKVGFIWNFNDGTPPSKGVSAKHTYSDAGEYWVTIQLDPAYGYSSELYRVRVVVVVPNISLRTSGDSMRSFVTIENRAEYEIDLSGWKVSSGGKAFTFYQNTLLVARGTIKLASEKTGLSTPVGISASLSFPNGTPVQLQSEIIPAPLAIPVPEKSFPEKIITKPSTKIYPQDLKLNTQEASVVDAITDMATSSVIKSEQKEGSMWPWYTGVAFFGAFAALGIRLARSKRTLADEFEIIEEKDDKPF